MVLSRARASPLSDVFPRRGTGTPTSTGTFISVVDEHEVNKRKVELSGRIFTETSCLANKQGYNIIIGVVRSRIASGTFRILQAYQTKPKSYHGTLYWSPEQYAAQLRIRRTPASDNRLENWFCREQAAGQVTCGQWTRPTLYNGWPSWPTSVYASRLAIFDQREDFQLLKKGHVYLVTKQTKPKPCQDLPKPQEWYAPGLSLYNIMTKPTDGLPYWYPNRFAAELIFNSQRKIPTPKWQFLSRYASGLTNSYSTLKKSGMGAHTELCSTSIGSDLEGQLQVVDGSRVIQQNLQEGFSTFSEFKPSLTNLARGDILATKSGMGAHAELCSTSIRSDLEDQLQVVDENKILQQILQEGFSNSFDASLTNLASRDILATDGTTFSIRAPSNRGMGALTRCSTSIGTEAENQLQAVDKNKFLQQSQQEGLSASPGMKPPLTNLAGGDITATDEVTPLIQDQHDHTWSKPIAHGAPSVRTSNGFAMKRQSKIGMGTLTKLHSPPTGNDLEDQLRAVDENEVLPQFVQEGFSAPPASLTNLASGDIIATDGVTSIHGHHDHTWSKRHAHGVPSGQRSVPCEKEETRNQFSMTGHSSASQTEKCSSLHPWSREKNDGTIVTVPDNEDGIFDLLPYHILSIATNIFGEYLNILMTHVLMMSPDKVRFRVYREEDSHNLGLSLTKEIPVYDPSDRDHYPEAFDANYIMNHMREHDNLCKYAEILDCLNPEGLMREINEILEKLPGRTTSPGHCPTFDSLCDTLKQMLRFIEQAAAGLFRKNETVLVAKLDEGYEHLQNILRAYEARQTLHP